MTTTSSVSSRRPHRVLAAVLAVGLVAGACSDDTTTGDTDDATTTTGDTTDATTTTDDTEDATGTEAGSDTDDATDTTTVPYDVPAAEVTGPVSGGDGLVLPQPAVPAPEGYVVEEFFVGGTATSFATVGETPADGFWAVEPAGTADYRTRIIVRRPPAEAFSGVVVVEWLNVSAVEASPDWAYLADEVGRAGHAYVAVSTQSIGVVGGDTLLDVDVDEEAAAELGAGDQTVAEGGLVNIDPERYGTLTHPGDAYAFDIFSQVGAALTAEADTILGGLEPTTVVAIGESQSAGFLTSYLNGVHGVSGVYDAFLVHSRGAGGASLARGFAGSADEEDAASFVTEGVTIRTDLDQPVMIVEAETDLTLLGYHAARQPDTDRIRTWEIAGTAHSDAHMLRALVGGPRDGSVGSLLGCTEPINTGPHKEVLSAALHHLVAWAEGGPPPPAGDRIELVDGDPVAIARDDLGIALGGVRNPLVDVPVAVPIGDPPENLTTDREEGFDICALFGQTLPLDQSTLLELHGSADEYVAAFEASAADAVSAGFLLPTDAEALMAEADANRALFG